MSSLANRVRASDIFGAKPEFRLNGETSFQTIGGGAISLCLQVLTLVYTCSQVASLISYSDPEISSFTILEDRNKMEKPINLGEHNMEFYFSLLNHWTNAPIVLDPAFGKFFVE